MTEITKALWNSEFPDKPMPANCTYQKFTVACAVKQSDEHNQWAGSYIAKLRKLQENATDEEVKSDFQTLIESELRRLRT